MRRFNFRSGNGIAPEFRNGKTSRSHIKFSGLQDNKLMVRDRSVRWTPRASFIPEQFQPNQEAEIRSVMMEALAALATEQVVGQTFPDFSQADHLT